MHKTKGYPTNHAEKREKKPIESQTKEASSSDLLTVHEVAQILRVDDTTVRRWITEGGLEAIKLPSGSTRQKYRIRRKTLDELLEPSFAK